MLDHSSIIINQLNRTLTLILILFHPEPKQGEKMTILRTDITLNLITETTTCLNKLMRKLHFALLELEKPSLLK